MYILILAPDSMTSNTFDLLLDLSQLEIVKILELSGIISSFSLKKNKNNSPEINNKVLKSKNNLNFSYCLSRE